jgi:hypothetical protein
MLVLQNHDDTKIRRRSFSDKKTVSRSQFPRSTPSRANGRTSRGAGHRIATPATVAGTGSTAATAGSNRCEYQATAGGAAPSPSYLYLYRSIDHATSFLNESSHP